MKLIVGLGNPGTDYQDTRHNAGRMVVEKMADDQSLRFSKKAALHAYVARFFWEGCDVALACPELFMNQSGESVLRLISEFKVACGKDLLIVVDDTALPFGKLRLRPRGSDGGHNGLKSVESFLKTSDYPRLRIGIGACAESEPLEDYVLAPFDSEQKKAWPQVLKKAAEACRLWATASTNAAMNAINGKK